MSDPLCLGPTYKLCSDLIGVPVAQMAPNLGRAEAVAPSTLDEGFGILWAEVLLGGKHNGLNIHESSP